MPRHFSIPATFSSVRTAQAWDGTGTITSDSTIPVEMGYLRMVFSAPMEISSERLLWAIDSNLQPW